MLRRVGRAALVVLIGAALIASGVWFYVSRAERSDGVAYMLAPVSTGTIRKIVSTSGPVGAVVTVQVGSQLSGQVIEVQADFNTEVKKGDILAVLDPKTFAVKVAQAKADLAAAKANVVNQRAALTKAEAVLHQADRNKERQQKLAAKGIAAESALDTADRDFEVAKSDLAVAKAQITVAEAQVEQREAALKQAEIDLDRTSIRAPIEGTVISRTVDPGQTVAASLQAPELFKIAQDLSRIRIEAQVNEADVGSISAGNNATFTVDAYPDRTFVGTVTQVRLAATELQNVVTYTVIVEARNDDRRLFPGMTANVEIETARRNDALRLPAEALRFRPREARRASSGSRRDRGAVWQKRLAAVQKRLSLSEEQLGLVKQGLKKLSAEMRALRSADTEEGNTGAGRSNRRETFSAKFEQLIRSVLTEQQLPLFEKWQKQRRGVRTATVWVLDGDGKPERRSVQIGIGDDNYVELKRGQLGDGDKVIIRRQRKR